MVYVLLIPIGLFLMLVLEGVLFLKTWVRGLEVSLSFSHSARLVGEKTGLTILVGNHKLQPIPVLQLAYQTREGLDFMSGGRVSVSDHVNVTEIFSLRSYETNTRQVEVTCDHRGYYEITRATMTAWTLFRHRAYTVELPQHTSLYVYPKLYEEEKIQVPVQRILGQIQARRFLFEDPFLIRGIRDYQSGDPMKNVNWKASARSGDLKVNVRDDASGQHICILLDAQDVGTLSYARELQEDVISIAATLVFQMIRQGFPVSLATNGVDIVTGEEIHLGEGASGEHLRCAMEVLARIDARASGRGFASLLEETCQDLLTPDTYVVVVSATQRDETLRAARELARVRDQERLFWICPVIGEENGNLVRERVEMYYMDHGSLKR